MKLKRKILKDGDKIPFTALSKKYGRAEFQICPVYKRGKLKELYLYPRQQGDATHYFVYIFKNAPRTWSVTSWTHMGVSEPYVWLNFWCEEHKAPSSNLYVPREAEWFQVRALSDFSIYFGKD